MLSEEHCPSCTGIMRPFFNMGSVPSNSCILLKSAAEAEAYPKGDIVLSFCDQCAFIRNVKFDPALTEYSGRYEETQGFSATFRRFHENLAHALIERHNLRGKEIVEIGCGKGEFLAMLCDLGGNSGIGFDPGYDDSRGVLDEVSDVSVISDFYSEAYATYQGDFVACKMTLEHIDDTAKFVANTKLSVRESIDSIVFFQVPETLRIVRDCAFEDIYYEHCSYFTPGSLARLFRGQGFEVLNLETQFEDQYLMIEARLQQRTEIVDFDALPIEEGIAEMREWVGNFESRCSARIKEWRDVLTTLADSDEVVLWGSGSKAVAFLHAVDRNNVINHVVDINPHRQGHYMPGSAQKIIAPDVLAEIRPGAVIIMNAAYVNEIRADLKAMDIAAAIHAL